MSTSEYKVVGGYYTAGQSPQINAAVNAAILDGWQPYGSPMLRGSGWVDQPVVKADTGTITEYRVVTGYSDNRTPKIAALVGWTLLGDTVRLDSSYFLQAYVLGQPVLPAATPFGASLLLLPDAAALKALIPPVNETFRASFTTTAGELSQLCAVANTPQVVTYNAQAIPNPDIGTLDNTTGVFTATAQVTGFLALNCQVRRTTGGASPVEWGIDIQTSPDGITWTSVAGSSRRINIRGGGDNNIMQVLGFAVSLNLPSGTRLRVRQSCSDASSNTGLVAAPGALGLTTSAGFIFSLYTVD